MKQKAKELASKFRENFKKFSNVSSKIIENGGPILIKMLTANVISFIRLNVTYYLNKKTVMCY